MGTLRALLPTILLGLLAACGQPADGTASERGPAEPAAAAAAPAEAPAAAGDGQAAAALETTVVEESPGEQPDPQAPLATRLAQADTAKPARQRQWRFQPGKHFSQLTSAQGTTTGAGGIEVAEVFWYGCPHCYNFDPYVERWRAKLPDDVRFVRLPVMWNPTNEIHARLFYTAEALGKLDEMHKAIFDAFHRRGKRLISEDEIRDFFKEFGVSPAEFDKAFRSFAVESKLRRARNLTQKYRIRSVPVMVVNGKYVTDGPEIKSFDEMLAVVDELIEREREGL
ncbi:MAG: thiol:disulfide interchange protein DsbA/DsbL [Gammaproteobacteria bacterium]|nr:MAG: thiol:disulfide interchange protein DsbA/DsbL [Gammaproteobacteria bacterium]